MKVGDLVRLLDDTEVRKYNMDIPAHLVAIVVEQGPPVVPESFASIWVQWQGRPDWDNMYIEDLVIVSESR